MKIVQISFLFGLCVLVSAAGRLKFINPQFYLLMNLGN